MALKKNAWNQGVELSNATIVPQCNVVADATHSEDEQELQRTLFILMLVELLHNTSLFPCSPSAKDSGMHGTKQLKPYGNTSVFATLAGISSLMLLQPLKEWLIVRGIRTLKIWTFAREPQDHHDMPRRCMIHCLNLETKNEDLLQGM